MTAQFQATRNQSLTLDTFNTLEAWRDAVISNLEDANYDQCVQVIEAADRLAESAFWVRGAAANRAVSLSEGETGKVIAQIAKDANVAPSTISYDRQIVSVFGVEILQHEKELSREYFRLAVSTDSPQETIELFRSKKLDNPGYSTRDAREDLKRLDLGESVAEVQRERFKKIVLTEAGQKALAEAQRYLDMSPSEIVEKLLLEWMEGHTAK